MVRSTARTVGAQAETLARRFLERQGLSLLQANFRCRLGELDLVLLHGEILVIAEVRRRGARSFAPAAVTVDRRKQHKIIRTTALFLARQPQLAQHTIRFDVVAIDVNGDGDLAIEWIRDAFRPADAQL